MPAGENKCSCGYIGDNGAILCPGCTTGDIRLAGGMNELEGRVEICVNNQWGTVCDRNWEAAEAAVACRQAGFSDAG